jgi:DNA-binding transcriptional regulator LsrR (DeoR family)
MIHGKPLEHILRDCLPVSNEENSSVAVFSGETLVAIIDKINGKWKYGCVFVQVL